MSSELRLKFRGGIWFVQARLEGHVAWVDILSRATLLQAQAAHDNLRSKPWLVEALYLEYIEGREPL